MRIMADDRFKPGVLDEILARIKSTPPLAIMRPELSYEKALVTVGAADDAMKRKSPEEGDREVEAAEGELRAVLAINPTDSFLWLLLYSVSLTRSGFDPGNISLLEQSYSLGPNEGWVALRRNRLALAIFPILSNATQRMVVSEFAGLVDARFVEDAAVNLTGVGWTHRATLVAGLERVAFANREALAKRFVGRRCNS
ncbi:hypothetical protein ACVWWK_008066 [Bradyrhizobium sp. LB9.1b]